MVRVSIPSAPRAHSVPVTPRAPQIPSTAHSRFCIFMREWSDGREFCKFLEFNTLRYAFQKFNF